MNGSRARSFMVGAGPVAKRCWLETASSSGSLATHDDIEISLVDGWTYQSKVNPVGVQCFHLLHGDHLVQHHAETLERRIRERPAAGAKSHNSSWR